MSDFDDKYNDDAWLELYNLQKKYTAKFELRRDLSISALAHERHIWIEVGEKNYRRTNVGTAREYAQMILDACDYVDKWNPGWASNHRINLDNHLDSLELEES